MRAELALADLPPHHSALEVLCLSTWLDSLSGADPALLLNDFRHALEGLSANDLENPWRYFVEAHLRFRLGQMTRVIEYSTLSIDLPDLHILCAQALAELGEGIAARDTLMSMFEQSFLDYSQRPNLLMTLGTVCARAGDALTARRYYQSALSRVQDWPHSQLRAHLLVALARCDIDLGNIDQARARLSDVRDAVAGDIAHLDEMFCDLLRHRLDKIEDKRPVEDDIKAELQAWTDEVTTTARAELAVGFAELVGDEYLDLAIGLLERSAEFYAAHDMIVGEAHARIQLSRLLEQTGAREDAARAVCRAISLTKNQGLPHLYNEAVTLRLKTGLPRILPYERPVFAAEETDQCDGFVLLSKIRTGTYARLFKGYDLSREKLVAIKVFDQELAMGARRDRPMLEPRTLFQRELDAALKVEHPHIAPVLASGEDRLGHPFLAYPFYEGPSLRDCLKDSGRGRKDLLSLVPKVAGALDRLHHQGLVHLDVKPENILLRSDKSPVLVDFGASAPIGARLEEGAPAGSMPYRPDEVKPGQRLRPTADIHALGVLLCELLLGQDALRDQILFRERGSRTINPFARYDGAAVSALRQSLAAAEAPEELATLASAMVTGWARRRPQLSVLIDYFRRIRTLTNMQAAQ